METKTFFTRSGNLICYWQKPKRVIEDGHSVVLEGPRIEFVPQADGYGRYVTSEPEEIAYLEKRAAEVGDILNGDAYQEATTPPEIQNRELKRTITQQNELIAVLREKEALLSQSATRKST